MERLHRRLLAGRIDDAARAAAAVKRGGGAAQDVDAVEREGMQLPARIGRVEELKPVEE
jgi:hypothetical protein